MRVLVVDDDVQLRGAVRAMLEELGHEVTETANGAEALRAFRRLGADVILCDVYMPERDGLEVLRALRAGPPGARVVSMSGGGNFHGTVDMLPLAGVMGAVAVLHK